MDELTWSHHYELGNMLLDEDHRKIIQFINDFEKVIDIKDDKLYLGNLLMELTKYCHHHFRREERFIKEIGFPDIAEHIKAHKCLRDRINSFFKDFESQYERMRYDILIFLHEWWGDHTLVMDMKYVRFYKNRSG